MYVLVCTVLRCHCWPGRRLWSPPWGPGFCLQDPRALKTLTPRRPKPRLQAMRPLGAWPCPRAAPSVFDACWANWPARAPTAGMGFAVQRGKWHVAASSVESPQAGAEMGHRVQCRPNSCGMGTAQVTIPIGLPARHGRGDTKEGPTQTVTLVAIGQHR